MGNNPKRTPENRLLHDKMIKVLAQGLLDQGYYVQADHILWINGAPMNYGGFVPDIIATNNNSRLIIEVEDDATYSDEYTRDQLTAFSKVQGYRCCLVVPDTCLKKDGKYKGRIIIRQMLDSWGIGNIYAGIFSSNKGTVSFT